MEMTMPTPLDLKLADFCNQTAGHGTFSPMTNIGRLMGLFAGPGLALACPTMRQWQLPAVHDPVVVASAEAEAIVMSVAPAAELIGRIKEGWSINMTELAELMGVQRPTLYNWLNGKTSPDAKFQKQLQTLAATAAVWKEATAGSNWDFLLDYSGPKADEVTIRETLARVDVSPGEIRELIGVRMSQYQEASARSREILGEPVPITGEPIRESTRKLNKRWTQHAQKIHRARNASK
jgi:transcriptional regulator with XRE-family HTH domain